jgi:hypothetical protein
MVTVPFASPSVVAVGIAGDGGARVVTGVIGTGIVMVTEKVATQVIGQATEQAAGTPRSKICIEPSATRRGQRLHPQLPVIVPRPVRQVSVPIISLRIAMATSIARPIKAGRSEPEKAGNPRKVNLGRPGNLRTKRPVTEILLKGSNWNAVNAPGNGVSNRHEATTGPGGAAAGVEVDAVNGFPHLII